MQYETLSAIVTSRDGRASKGQTSSPPASGATKLRPWKFGRLALPDSTSPRKAIITHSTCPVCGSSEVEHALTAHDHTVSGRDFEIWQCATCTLRFTQSIPDEDEIGAFYESEDYVSHSNTSDGLINGLYQRVRKITLGRKRQMVSRATGKKSGRLLDYGCGTGEFLGTMKAAGWDPIGLEPDKGARELARKNHGVDVREPSVLSDLASDVFDAITMWHVLEHVHRLHETLDEVKRTLTSSGRLIIAVPNYRSRDAGHYGHHWAAYDVPRHLYHFTVPSMKRVLSDHGFDLVATRHMPFDPFYVSLLSEKYQHGSERLVPAFVQGSRSFAKSSGAVEHASSIIYTATPADAAVSVV